MQEIYAVESLTAIGKLAYEGIVLSMISLMSPTAGVSREYDFGKNRQTSDALHEYKTGKS